MFGVNLPADSRDSVHPTTNYRRSLYYLVGAYRWYKCTASKKKKKKKKKSLYSIVCRPNPPHTLPAPPGPGLPSSCVPPPRTDFKADMKEFSSHLHRWRQKSRCRKSPSILITTSAERIIPSCITYWIQGATLRISEIRRWGEGNVTRRGLLE